MDKRNMRIGDFVRDPEQNENLRVTLNEIEYSEIFEGIPLKRRFFDKNAFKALGKIKIALSNGKSIQEIHDKS